MAWQNLRTDYTDAVWSGLKKYVQVDNPDDTVSFQDVTQYSNKEKSFFGARDANRMNEAINYIMASLNKGTDLYDTFLRYFDDQKGMFNEHVSEYIEEIERDADRLLDGIKDLYKEDIEIFQTQQEKAFSDWFNGVREKLTEDVAGKLQEEIEERLPAILRVSSPEGSTTTIFNGTKSYESTESQFDQPINAYGKWTIQITNGRQDAEQEINVDDVKIYPVVMSYYGARIVVDYPVGSTCTCTKGRVTLTAPDTSGHYAFVLPEEGEWTIKITDGENERTAPPVNVTEEIDYHVTIAYYTATLRMTVDTKQQDATLKLELEGRTVYSQPAQSGDISISARGRYTVSLVGNETGETKASQVTFEDDGQEEEVSLSLFGATISVSAPDTISVNTSIKYKQVGSGNSITIYAYEAGEISFSCTDGSESDSQTVSVTDGLTKSIELSYTPTKSFSECTDEELVKMVQASNDGKINLEDFWTTGEERTIHLSAMAGIEASETHAEQDITWVLAKSEGKQWADGSGEVAFKVIQKGCLENAGKINTENTNALGWNNPRRTWLQTVFKSAMPSVLQPIFKEFKTPFLSKGDISQDKLTNGVERFDDYFSFPTIGEILGTANNTAEDEFKANGGASAQWEYYKSEANRTKPKATGAEQNSWWAASPSNYSTAYPNGNTFGAIRDNGVFNFGSANTKLGISPYTCLGTKYIRGSIKVTYPSDATSCTLSKGSEVYSATSNPFTFSDLKGGEWTLEILGADGQNITRKIQITENGVEKTVVITQWSRTMTVKIDLSNSNPETCCTYADDAVGMTPGSAEWDDFFGHYPVLLQEGVEVNKLNRNNFRQLEDGTPVSIFPGGGKDAMIAFPRRGLSINTVGNILTVSMTDADDAPEFEYNAHMRGDTVKDKFYLGAFKGYDSGVRLTSVVDKTPTTSMPISTFRQKAQRGGNGYDICGFYQLTFIQSMYILKYKNLNSQTAVGRGYVDGNSGAADTGGTTDKGMDFGETTGRQQMKLFGIEDFWGNIYEFIDGIFIDSQYNLLTATQNFNDTGSGYTNNGKGGQTANVSGYMTRPRGTTKSGFVISAGNGSETTGFCDHGDAYGGRLASFGGHWGDAGIAGAFRLYVNRSASYAAAACGGRLMYL